MPHRAKARSEPQQLEQVAAAARAHLQQRRTRQVVVTVTSKQRRQHALSLLRREELRRLREPIARVVPVAPRVALAHGIGLVGPGRMRSGCGISGSGGVAQRRAATKQDVAPARNGAEP